MGKSSIKKEERKRRFDCLFGQVNKAAFWITLTISVALITISFFLPPQGAVDPSVLASTGELFAFASLATVIEGIEKGRSVSLQKGETQVHINKDTTDITE